MKPIILIYLAFILLTACDKPRIDCIISKENIAGSYKLIAAAYKSSPTAAETDYYDIILPEACDKDDVLTFKTDGSFVLTDAGMKCSPVNDDSGVWTLNGNILTSDGDETTIENFDCNKLLVLSISDVYVTGDKLKMTYTRQ